jgi:tripartite-type tricarboxylate transporter receptor subunit TctC
VTKLLSAAVAGGLCLIALSASPASAADPVAEFYKDKSIDLYIGFTEGGGYDLYARLVGRHITKHIPGQPRVVPKQMVGAGSRTAAAYVYNVAPRDGTVLATADQSLAIQQALGEDIKLDNNKFQWIGNPNADINTLAVWHTAGVKTIDDAKKKEVVVGATGPNTSAQYPQVLNTMLGTRFKIITGYPGGADVNLAMERGEVMGRGSNAWASWKSTHPQWLRDKKVDILVQIGLKKADDLPDVPLLMDLATNPDDRAALMLLSAGTAIGRPLFSTPDVPKERVEALRRAFDATMKDPAFLADAKKADLDLNPVSGEELQKIVADVVATPAPIAKRLLDAIEGRDVIRDLTKEKK